MLAAAVTLSILGLLLGPLLLAWGRGRALPSAAIEGFTLGIVPAVVLLRLSPHVYEDVGPLSLALLSSGYLALWIVERRRHRSLGRAGQVLALPALVVHAAADGATLGVVLGGGERAAHALGGGWLIAAALLVHRLPEGLFVARALVPERGWKIAVVWLGVLSTATIAGALFGERALSLAPPAVFHGVVAVGLGAILRLATHTHERTPKTRKGILVFVGALVFGLALNAVVPQPSMHPDVAPLAHEPVVATMAGLVALVAIIGVGLLRFAPRSFLQRLGMASEHAHDHAGERDDAPSEASVSVPGAKAR